MKKLLIIILGLILLLVSIACASSAPKVTAPSVQGAPPATTITRAAPTTAVPSPAKGGEASVNYSDVATADRMIVRTGNLSLIVDDVANAINGITKLTTGYGGHIVSSNSWKEGERLVGNISVRVPVERFDQAMAEFRNLSVDIVSETTSSKDVTEEYSDLSARLTNLQAAEKQLLVLMEKAQKIEDILAIQRELTNTRGQIEQIKGRMQYLERTSDTSLITVQLQQSKLSVDFSASRSSVKTGEEIRFSGKIAGGFAPYSYLWDFGDGRTSTEPAPVYTYKASGSYTVTLKITDDHGNIESQVRKSYITVLPGWDIGRVASSAWNGLSLFGRVLANVLVWWLVFSPVWLIAGGIVFFVWRKRRKAAK